MSANCIRFVKRYLCVKKLTVNDGFTTRTVKLPRAEARFFMGELRNRQATPLVLLDEDGSCWELLCTCTGGQYALSRIGAFCETHGARPGCYFIFYADHDHIVRLAVRQSLPEDVQAAVAAARAALAVRTSPQRAPEPQVHPQPLPALGATLGPNHAPQPVLDDPAALDEMPISTDLPAGSQRQQAVTAPSALSPRQVVTTEPPRPLPLQDRSNFPVGGPLSEAAGNGSKAKAAASKPAPSAVTPAAAVCTVTDKENVVAAAAQLADKENVVAAAAQLADKAHVLAATAPKTSTGGFSAPVVASHSPSQQKPGPRPPAPPPPSPAQGRPAPQQTLPPPGSRLRLRFEARLRAQAGRPHPLSVRSGPDSPPPAALGSHDSPDSGGGVGFWLGGPCPLQQAANLGSGLLPFNWGVATWNRRASAPGCYSHEGPPHAAGRASGGGSSSGSPYGCGAGCEPSPYAHQEEGSPAAAAVGLDDCEEPQLQCDELLDWEAGGRRPASEPELAAAAFLVDTGPGPGPLPGSDHTSKPGLGQAVNPGWAALEPASLLLLRQLFARGPNQLMPDARDGCSAGQNPIAQQEPPDPTNRRLQAVCPAPAGTGSREGVLLSRAATSSTLRNLLGSSSSAAAGRDLAATSGAAGAPGADAAPAAAATEAQRPAGAAPPPDECGGARSADCLAATPGAAARTAGAAEGASVRDVDGQRSAPAAAHTASSIKASPAPGDGPGSGRVFEVFEARAKSSLSISRDAPGPPLDSPSTKRSCSVWELFPAFSPALRGGNGPSAAPSTLDCGSPAATAAPLGQAPQPAQPQPNPTPASSRPEKRSSRTTPVSQLFLNPALTLGGNGFNASTTATPRAAPPAVQPPPRAAAGGCSSHAQRGSSGVKTTPMWEIFPALGLSAWSGKRPPVTTSAPASASATPATTALQCPPAQLQQHPSPAAPRIELAGKALTAHDLLMDRVALSVAATTWSLVTGLPLRGAEPGRIAPCPATAQGGSGAEPMDVDTRALSAKRPSAWARGGACTASAVTTPGLSAPGSVAGQPHPKQQPRVAGSNQIVPVMVEVESGATYEAALLTADCGTSAAAVATTLECELQGLRPYLIRRQAGVGDVLTLWLSAQVDTGCAGSTLHLHARLQQRAVAG